MRSESSIWSVSLTRFFPERLGPRTRRASRVRGVVLCPRAGSVRGARCGVARGDPADHGDTATTRWYQPARGGTNRGRCACSDGDASGCGAPDNSSAVSLSESPWVGRRRGGLAPSAAEQRRTAARPRGADRYRVDVAPRSTRRRAGCRGGRRAGEVGAQANVRLHRSARYRRARGS